MSRRLVSAVMVIWAFFALRISAEAGIPSAANSSVDPCVVSCPAGDVAFHVVTRHADNSPWAEGPVNLSFCGCPGFHLEPRTSPYGVATDGCTLTETPAWDGTSVFPVAAGGLCAARVHIDAEGVPLGDRAVASVDQDGDLVVSGPDLALVQSKIGTSDPTADFDADGVVTSADLAFAQAHLGHTGVETDVGRDGGVRGGLRFSRGPWPNPTRGAVAFTIVLPRESSVEISIVDLTGRRVTTLWSGPLTAGEHTFLWKGETSRGGRARSGLYRARLRAGDRGISKLFSLIH